jgi:hypothetical protein
MSTVDELVAFLRGCLDEDERVARAVPAGFDLFDGTGIVVMPLHGGLTRSVTLPSSVAIFAALHDPARVLREVESKRAILDAHPIEYSKVSDYTDCANCIDEDGDYDD